MATRDPRSNKDDIPSIPTLKPAHDEVRGRRIKARSSASSKPPAKSGGGGGFFTGLAFLIAIAACGAAYHLWQQQQLAVQRIAALEAQLASTGDEMSQSDAAVRIRLKELDSEVRKLWDNVWKKSKATLEQHDKNIKNLTTRSQSLTASTTKANQQVKEINAELTRYAAALDEVSEVAEEAQADARQAAALREKLPQLTNRVDDHEQRITNNEEWVESINAFRRQVNQRLNDRSQPAYEAPQLQ
jgi:methyl-accepting chemotaxis protein